MKFIDPTNDYAFKRIFGNEKHPKVLISFLNAVLAFPPGRQIIQVKILNPNQAPKIEELKETLLDVRAVDQRGQSFIVEMQVELQQAFGKRALYYTSNAYVQQLDKGEDYGKLNKIYFVGILNFKAMPGEDCVSNHLILNKKTKENFLTDFEFCFVELPKFRKNEKQLKDVIDKWIYFVKYVGEKDYDVDYKKLFKGERAILEALKIAEFHGMNKKEWEIYEYREKKRRDEFETRRTAIEIASSEGLAKGLAKGKAEGLAKGKAEGLAKGLAKGKAEGLAKGLAKGKAEGLAKGEAEGLAKGKAEGEKKLKAKIRKIAKILKKEGNTSKEIRDATDLSLEEIEKL